MTRPEVHGWVGRSSTEGRQFEEGHASSLVGTDSLAMMNPLLSNDSSGEIISARAIIVGGGFDFSRGDCGCPPCTTACPYDSIFTSLDMYWIFVFHPPYGESLHTPFGGIPLGDVPLDSVLVAPAAGYHDHIGEDINEMLQIDHTYVVKTREAGHAVFRIVTFDTGNSIWTIDYKLQTDGSGVFDGVPTMSTTWGRIKSIVTDN